jgi:transposase
MDTTGRVRRKHRSWPEALKREIVAAASVPGASVSAVARQYDVNTNMVFTWRKRNGGASASAAPPQLVPVVVTPEQINATPPATARIHAVSTAGAWIELQAPVLSCR